MSSAKKRELLRDDKQGKIGGVCAGIANYFGWELWVVRIIAVTALILATKVTFVAYIVAWVVLDKEPKAKKSKSTYGKAGFDEDEQTTREETRIERTSDGRTIEVKTRVWEAGKAPHLAMDDIELEFSRMEKTLRNMETYVTSSEFQVLQEFKKL